MCRIRVYLGILAEFCLVSGLRRSRLVAHALVAGRFSGWCFLAGS